MDMIRTDFLKLTVVNSTANSLGLINVSYDRIKRRFARKL